jgi:hypothetical protein
MDAGNYKWMDGLAFAAGYLSETELDDLFRAMRLKLERGEDTALARLAELHGGKAFVRHYPKLASVWARRWRGSTRIAITRISRSGALRSSYDVELQRLLLRLSPWRLIAIHVFFWRHRVLKTFWRRRAARLSKRIASSIGGCRALLAQGFTGKTAPKRRSNRK